MVLNNALHLYIISICSKLKEKNTCEISLVIYIGSATTLAEKKEIGNSLQKGINSKFCPLHAKKSKKKIAKKQAKK